MPFYGNKLLDRKPSHVYMQNGHSDLLVVRPKQSVELLQILPEHGLVIPTGQGDLKHLTT